MANGMQIGLEKDAVAFQQQVQAVVQYLPTHQMFSDTKAQEVYPVGLTGEVTVSRTSKCPCGDAKAGVYGLVGLAWLCQATREMVE